MNLTNLFNKRLWNFEKPKLNESTGMGTYSEHKVTSMNELLKSFMGTSVRDHIWSMIDDPNQSAKAVFSNKSGNKHRNEVVKELRSIGTPICNKLADKISHSVTHHLNATYNGSRYSKAVVYLPIEDNTRISNEVFNDSVIINGFIEKYKKKLTYAFNAIIHTYCMPVDAQLKKLYLNEEILNIVWNAVLAEKFEEYLSYNQRMFQDFDEIVVNKYTDTNRKYQQNFTVAISEIVLADNQIIMTVDDVMYEDMLILLHDPNYSKIATFEYDKKLKNFVCNINNKLYGMTSTYFMGNLSSFDISVVV